MLKLKLCLEPISMTKAIAGLHHCIIPRRQKLSASLLNHSAVQIPCFHFSFLFQQSTCCFSFQEGHQLFLWQSTLPCVHLFMPLSHSVRVILKSMLEDNFPQLNNQYWRTISVLHIFCRTHKRFLSSYFRNIISTGTLAYSSETQ